MMVSRCCGSDLEVVEMEGDSWYHCSKCNIACGTRVSFWLDNDVPCGTWENENVAI